MQNRDDEAERADHMDFVAEFSARSLQIAQVFLVQRHLVENQQDYVYDEGAGEPAVDGYFGVLFRILPVKLSHFLVNFLDSLNYNNS